LIEVYDLNQSANSQLANISTRAFVSTADNIVIAGFILGNNSGSDKVVVRGIGPSLGAVGVLNALANPLLELRDSNGTLLQQNNNWADDVTQAAELTAAGLAPSGNLEAALVATLPPGAYTTLLAGLTMAPVSASSKSTTSGRPIPRAGTETNAGDARAGKSPARSWQRRFFHGLASWSKSWLLSFAGWSLIPLVLGAKLAADTGGPWTMTIRPGIRDWLPWAVLTPILFRFVRRFPIDRQSWKARVPLHVACCVVVVALCQLHHSVRRPCLQEPRTNPGTSGQPRPGSISFTWSLLDCRFIS
jgi:hypothetical protein